MGADLHGDPLPPGSLARLGSIRLMHPHVVNDLVFSPDGSLLASCQDEILVSELPSGRARFRIPAHRGRTTALAFSPDSGTLASVGDDGTLRLWNTQDGTLLRKIFLGREEGRAVAYLDATLIVVGAYTNVSVFTARGKRICKLGQAKGWVTSLVCHPSLHRAYVATERGLWRFGLPRIGLLRNKQPADDQHRALSEESCRAVGLSADGRRLAVSQHDATLLLDVDSEREIGRLPTSGAVNTISFSPDGRTILTCGRASAQLWTVEGALLSTFAENYYGVEVGRISPSGDLLATGAHGGDVRLWEPSGQAELLSWPRHRESVSALCFSPDGSRLLTTSTDHSLRVWDAESGRAIHQLDPGKEAGEQIAYAPDGRFFAIARKDGRITLFDAETFEPRMVLSTPDRSGWFRSLTISPDSRSVVSCEGGVTLHLWSVEQKRPLWSRPVGLVGQVATLHFSPDGLHLAACGGQVLRVWRSRDGGQVCDLGETIHWFAFADAQTLVGAGTDGFIRSWDLQTGEQRDQGWYRGSGPTFSPGAALVALAEGKEVGFFTWPGLAEVGRLPSDGDWVAMAFSSDGQRFACVERARNVIVWDVSRLASAPRGARLEYPDAARLEPYRLRLQTLPAARFAEVRLGAGCATPCSPNIEDEEDFLGIAIHIADRGAPLSDEDGLALSFDPPASPLVPMCGYLCCESGVDLDNIYVVAVDEQSGARFRGRLRMQRPTSAQLAPEPDFDDPEDAGDPRAGSLSRIGSWFNINLSEQIPIPERPAVYQVRLEHAVVTSLRSESVRVEIVDHA